MALTGKSAPTHFKKTLTCDEIDKIDKQIIFCSFHGIEQTIQRHFKTLKSPIIIKVFI